LIIFPITNEFEVEQTRCGFSGVRKLYLRLACVPGLRSQARRQQGCRTKESAALYNF
jgi:hypothetical protein